MTAPTPGHRAATGALALLMVSALAPSAAAQSGPAVPHFVDETRASGVRSVYDGDWQFYVGGGVAAFDCTDDGKPELFLAGGENSASLWRNDSKTGGKLKFSRVKDAATDLTSVTGAYPLDIDGDGVTDLAVLRVGEAVLLRGLGGCRFERANEMWGFDGGDAWTTAFSATWEGDAALPTLALGTYVDTATSNERIGSCGENRLVRPDAAGTAYGPGEPLTPGFCALSTLFSDWNRSGQRDLRVSNDRHYAPSGEEQLWRMTPGEPPTQYSEADGWQELRIWGMGIASQDLTGDGRPEVYLTSMGDNKLQELMPETDAPMYQDIALERGVTATKPFTGGDVEPSTSWHAEFEDINNDTYPDLYVSKGNVEAMPEYAKKDPNDLFIGQPDGSFVQGAKAAGIVDFDRTRGAAIVDLNLDGLLDIVEVNRRENVRVWRDIGSGSPKRSAPMGGFLALRLSQDAPNSDAIGSWIEVRTGDRTVTREVTVGGGHASGQLGWIHFGLGDAAAAEVRVQWPDGEWGPWLPVTANSFSIVERDPAAVTPWAPPA